MNQRDRLADRVGEDLLFLDPAEQFDSCIVGVVYRCGMDPVVCYDEEKVIQSLEQSGMDREEAEEFFSFNTAGAYVGPQTPVFLTRAT